MLKYLRIAVTALCLTACVLLIALWVRSYWRFDGLYVIRPNNGGVSLVLGQGHVNCTVEIFTPFWYGDWLHESRPARPFSNPDLAARGFAWKYGKYGKNSLYVKVPYWFLVILAAMPASPFRKAKSYSLRTLLIATTLVAVVLGLFVMAR